MHITQVIGGEHLHVHTCRFAPFPISETAGRIALKFDVWLETHYLAVSQKSSVEYIRTCARADVPLFRISETVGRIALKFGMW